MSIASQDSVIRPLRPPDVEGAIRLTRAAGWNQLPGDWGRLLSLEPEGCFALDCDGQLAATSTVVTYGQDLAWVGMVLTAPEFRRRGFAESLIVRALEFADQRNIATLGLDATESGIGLYRKHGFLEDCKIERWQRAPWPVDPGEALVYEPDPRYDQMYFGADRRRLLAQLAKLEAASVRGEGYAMGRPGFSAAYFGPCVANSPAAAQTLLRWFLGNHPRETIFWDLFPDNQEVVNIAQEFGFRPVRRLERMTFRRNRARPIANPPEIYAIAGFELG